MYAICRNAGCSNQGYPLQVPPDTENIVCGVCGVSITELVETPPALPTEVPSWLA